MGIPLDDADGGQNIERRVDRGGVDVRGPLIRDSGAHSSPPERPCS